MPKESVLSIADKEAIKIEKLIFQTCSFRISHLIYHILSYALRFVWQRYPHCVFARMGWK